MSYIKCQQCGKYAPPEDPALLCCGDLVAFEEVLQLDSGDQMRNRNGVIVEADAESVLVSITGSKAKVRMNRSDVHKMNSPSPRFYEYVGMCSCA